MNTYTNKLLTVDEILFRKSNGPVATYLMNVAPSSQRTILNCLKAALKALNPEYLDKITSWLMSQGLKAEDAAYMVDWHLLRQEQVLLIQHQVEELYEPRYGNSVLSCVRQVIRECEKLDLIPREDCLRAVDFPNFRLKRIPGGRAVNAEEFHLLIEHCLNMGLRGLRDAAIIACFSSGVRISELCNLDLSSYDQRDGRLTVLGKGNRFRDIFVPVSGQPVLNRWITYRGHEDGPLFIVVRDPNFFYRDRRLGDRGIADMLSKRAAEAGIDRFTPHDLRRGTLTELLDRGVDVRTVANIAGHTNVDTLLQWYDRRDDTTQREAYYSLNLPFFDSLDT